jgi:iron(III) transport system substrate-binding protein
MTFTISRRGVLAGMAATMLPTMLPKIAFSQTASGTVVVYTPNPAQVVDAVTESLRQIEPGISLSTITGGSGQLLRRIEAEASAPQADVFWSSSENTLGAFRQLFEPYRSKELSAIPEALHQKEDLWSATITHVVVAMVNSNLLGDIPAPKLWADFLDPKWKGKVAIADPNNSSTAYTILWGIEQLMGKEFLEKLARNVLVNSSASSIMRGVAQGEFVAGLTFEANAYAYVAGGQVEIALVYPEEGTFTSPEFMALIKGAPNADLGRRTMDVLLSKEMQVALLENTFRRPSRSDIVVSDHVDLPGLDKIKIFATNEADAAAGREAFLARWQGYVQGAK